MTPPRRPEARVLRTVAVAALTTLALAGCGSRTAPGAGDRTTAGGEGTAVTGHLLEPGTLLAGHGMVLQADGEPAQLCLGAVAESYPPQCGGPELVGFPGWEALPGHESASGTTWSEAYVVGSYDGERFTLDRPPTPDPPPGWEPVTSADPPFPQLCEDPAAGVDGSRDGTTEDALLARERATQAAAELEGYVTAYLSGADPTGSAAEVLNVVVTGDAATARDALREVYQGPLCVEQREGLPTQAQVRSAQAALGPQTVPGFLHSGSGVDAVLDVGVVVADRATVATVLRLVSPWLSPEQVRVSGALRPYRQP